jgi:hypothetical protein
MVDEADDAGDPAGASSADKMGAVFTQLPIWATRGRFVQRYLDVNDEL